MTIRKTPIIPIPESTPEEIWRDVPGYEGLYMASSLGRVYSAVREKFLKPRPSTKKYLRVAFTKDGVRKDLQIHNVVALTFIGPCPDGLEVNHKNGIKSDNRPDNFEYGTHQSNVQHAWDTGLRKNRIGGRKLEPHQVTEIRQCYDRLREKRIESGKKKIARGELKSLAIRFGVTTNHVYSIATGKVSRQLEYQIQSQR